MRLQPIPPERFDDDQRALYDRIQRRTAQSRGFRTAQPDGAMIGPYNAMLHHPDLGSAMWSMIEALSRHGHLDARCQDVAVLVVGARFGARYELYAHEHTAAAAGLTPDQVATITAGSRPADLSAPEGIVYDVAHGLVGGGALPQSVYDLAVRTLGDEGFAELCFLVGAYGLVSVVLNGYDMPVPTDESGG